MDLAKPQVDVGLFTEQLDAMQAFYGEKLGLQFESLMPVGGGFRQYRYLCNGSVIKLMHSRDPLRRRRPGGYEALMLASPKVKEVQALADPDDNTVELLPPGRDDVTQMEIRVGVRDVDAFGEFYKNAFGAVDLGNERYRIGETIFGVYHEPEIHRAPPTPFANPLEVVKAMAELGIQYVTVQVRNCDAAFNALKAAGAAVGIEPANFGTVARICFVRDPDGNFIEISQRPPSQRASSRKVIPSEASMVTLGNHMKMTVASRLKGRTREFYQGLLGLTPIQSPAENLDLYEFPGGFVMGIFFSDDRTELLSEADYLKATWLELKVDDLASWKSRLQEFGVTEIEYEDPSRFQEPYLRFFFQAPGGQVFRLAPLG